ncbi:hypothetical protein PHMEG_00027341 [Phytophthora megakarya]|uniref:Uncharacterized protein n=1 Tax=Phytophthora megakarya TaxID=4795 RepID=A0A225V745_9STRA|nr:hypothetical protein PHMEG_00027341 [Phytophthora megakarya]
MALINLMEMRLQELMVAHERLVEALQLKEDRITTDPESKIHGFATTIKPLRQPGVHEIRFIAGQEGYVSREVEGAPGMLFNFTETGNPIDLRNNFQRCCRSRWEENETISLEEVASIVNNLIDETNGHMRLATLYADIHNRATLFVRAQRFRLPL